MGFLRSLD
uniref:Uncharacterized protein n=1 Tax=Arundo donax TaxID=35708 RepID=A0A0A9TSU7_ARUDO